MKSAGSDSNKTRLRSHLRLIRLIGVMVPGRLRADWRQEWEAELRHREALLAQWENLNWRTKLELLRRSLGAFWDALLLQPQRLEDEMFQDLRYGARMLIKSPGVTLIAIVTLALGIGANTTIFSLASAFFLRPMPGSEPERLVTLDHGDRMSPISYPNYLALRDNNNVLAGLAITYEPLPMSFGDGKHNELVLGEVVSGNYFDVLGIRPVLGRTFLPEEDRTPGAHPVVVISYNLWQNRLGGVPDLAGKTVTLNGRQFTVVGIAAQGFSGLYVTTEIDLWVPSMMLEQTLRGHRLDLNDRSRNAWGAFGRLKPGVTLAQAQTVLETINRQFEEATPLPPNQSPSPEEARPLRVSRPRGIPLPHFRRMAAIATTFLAAVTGVVLLIVCANVANLLLARASVRRKEIAVRLALGASRWRLIRQLLTESLLLALLGAGAGLGLAFWLNRLLSCLTPPAHPPWNYSVDVHLNTQVLIPTLFLAFITSLLFGLVPALQASKPDLVPALKDETGSETRRGRRLNLRGSLVVGQIAVSMVLLSTAGLFVRSLQRLQTLDPGFEIENGLVLPLRLELQGYDQTRGAALVRRLLERIGSLPGVEAVTASNFVPLGGEANSTSVRASGHKERVDTGKEIVDPNFLRTMKIPLLRGRDFTEQDSASAPKVTIINEALAARLFPGEEAVGKQIRGGPNDEVVAEVIGIAKDTAFRNIGEEPRPIVYRPFEQEYSTTMHLVARTTGDPKALFGIVRNEVQACDPNIPTQYLKTLSEHAAFSLWPTRMGATVVSVFGLLSLVLATVGIYGVMAYSVAQRLREIGVRMALGAQSGDVLKLIIRQGMVMTLIGASIGLLLALAVTRLLRGALFGLSPTDPVTFIIISFLVVMAALAACYFPARRATRVDPIRALRTE